MDEWASRQRYGQNLYREHDYRAALAVFDTLIFELHDPPASVLDNRAATYSKLGDLPNALKDGKRMIHIDKKDATGYLRTGQVLRLMGKDQTALDLYKYGLKHVAKDGKGSDLLRAMKERLVKQLSDPASIDPLQVLPLELIEMVLGYLNFRTLQRLLSVSKQWKNLITSMPKLWRHIDLSQARRRVPVKSVKEYANRGKKQTTHITIHRVDYGDSDLYKAIVNRCPRLNTLELTSGESNASLISVLPMSSNLSTLIVGRQRKITLDAVDQILERCPNLTTAEFHSIEISRHPPAWKGDMSKLSILTLGSSVYLPSASALMLLNLGELIPKIPNLEKLEISGLSASHLFRRTQLLTLLPKLCSLNLEVQADPDVSTIRECCPMLQVLCIDNGNFVMMPSDEDASSVFPYLEKLMVKQMKLESFACLSCIIDPHKGKLKEFGCSNMAFGERESSIYLLNFIETGCLCGAKSITLGGQMLTDHILLAIAKHCPELEEIRVPKSPLITGVGIKSLVSKDGRKLKELDISECEGIGHDAIDWAKQQGILVIRNKPSANTKSARKIH